MEELIGNRQLLGLSEGGRAQVPPSAPPVTGTTEQFPVPTAPPLGPAEVVRYVLGMDDGSNYVNLNDVFDSLFASCAIHARWVAQKGRARHRTPRLHKSGRKEC